MSEDPKFIVLFGKSAMEAWLHAGALEARFLAEREKRWRHGDSTNDTLPDQCASRILRRDRTAVSKTTPMQTKQLAMQNVAEKYGISTPVQVLCASRTERATRGNRRSHLFESAFDARKHIEIEPGVLIPTPELTLCEFAEQATEFELLLATCELCSLYAVCLSEEGKTSLPERPAIANLEKLADEAIRIKGKRNSQKVHRVCNLALSNSRSPQETAVALLLSLPHSMGGYKLPKPLLNKHATLSLQGRNLQGADSIECDLLWKSRKVAAFYESNEFHLTPSQLAKDTKRDAALVASGYTVFRISSEQTRNRLKADALAKSLGKQLGKQIRPQLSDFARRQNNLRWHLHL